MMGSRSRLATPADSSKSWVMHIEQAAERVVRRYREDPLIAADVAALRQEVAALVDSIRGVLSGPTVIPPRTGIADPLGLLRALRTEVVNEWPEDLPLLPTMRAIESVQNFLRDHVGDEDADAQETPPPRLVLREVAHMMRSPLASIILLTETLREQVPDLPADKSRRSLSIIHNAAVGLLVSAGDVLTMIDEPDGAGSTVRFSPDETLTTVADLVAPVTEVRSCELVVQPLQETPLVGPASTIRRAMLALALGVARRTRDGRITIGATRGHGDSVVFFVTGEGPGAKPEEALDELLEIFRPDQLGDGSFTLAAEALSFSAAARLLRGIGSDLTFAGGPGETLHISFELELPANG